VSHAQRSAFLVLFVAYAAVAVGAFLLSPPTPEFSTAERLFWAAAEPALTVLKLTGYLQR
jgi:hypothetical protein